MKKYITLLYDDYLKLTRLCKSLLDGKKKKEDTPDGGKAPHDDAGPEDGSGVVNPDHDKGEGGKESDDSPEASSGSSDGPAASGSAARLPHSLPDPPPPRTTSSPRSGSTSSASTSPRHSDSAEPPARSAASRPPTGPEEPRPTPSSSKHSSRPPPPPGTPSEKKRKVSVDEVEEKSRRSERIRDKRKNPKWKEVWSGEWVTG